MGLVVTDDPLGGGVGLRNQRLGRQTQVGDHLSGFRAGRRLTADAVWAKASTQSHTRLSAPVRPNPDRYRLLQKLQASHSSTERDAEFPQPLMISTNRSPMAASTGPPTSSFTAGVSFRTMICCGG